MNSGTPKIDLKNYTKQNNLAVDMVVACIQHTRGQGVEPKAIMLNEKYFGLFKIWVEKNYGEEMAVQNDFYIDCIEVRQETIRSGKTLWIEYWQVKRGEA